MRWQDAERSPNVDDVRGQRFGGGGMPVRLGGMGGMGLGGLVAIMAITYLLGGDPFALLTGGVPTETAAPPSAGDTRADRRRRQQVRQDGAAQHRDGLGRRVPRAARARPTPSRGWCCSSNAVPSACGTNSSAVGPFYCPPDQRVYIDLSFYNELDRRFGAPGDFAQAYVIAHEVGHHVQNLLGHRRARCAPRSSAAARRRPTSSRCAWSCRPTAWPACGATTSRRRRRRSKVRLDPGDVEEGMRAAAAIGDDAIQRKAQGQRDAGELDARLVRAARAVAAPRPRQRPGRAPATRSGRKPLAVARR